MPNDPRDFQPGPELMPRNRLADWAREYGLYGLSDKLNSPTSGVGMVVDAVGGLGNALFVQPAESFNRLMTNGYERGNPQSAEDAFNVAGAAMVGGLAAPKPSNTVGIFGGRLAKTADQAKLAQAEKMAAEGAPREQIWNETGWFKAPDGKWRWEIDDSKSVVYPGYLEQTGKSEHAAPFRDRMSHYGYLQAYPEAEQLNVQRISDDMAQSRGSDGIYYRDRGIAFNGSPPDRGRSTALHELQHDVQAREGFAYGGNPKQFETAPQVGAGGTGRRFNWSGETPVEKYRRLAGEVEARAVEARRDLTPEQRAARPPWLDYDVPEANQIVRFDSNGPSQSIGMSGRPQEAVNAAGERPVSLIPRDRGQGTTGQFFDIQQNGNIVGDVSLTRNGDTFHAMPFVNQQYRGKGIGTEVYKSLADVAEKQGGRLGPSPALTDEGYALWKKFDPGSVSGWNRKDGSFGTWGPPELYANGGKQGAAVGAAANAPQDQQQNPDLVSILNKYGLGHLLQPTDWARKMQPGDA